MASQELYNIESVQRPTIQQLEKIAEKLHFQLTSNDLEHHKASIDGALEVFDRIEKQIEPPIPTKHPTTAGYQPSPASNPYNAWARITDIRGSLTGKLAGKNVAIKDNMHIAGVPMSCGSTFLSGFVSSYNATVVNRVLDEGAVIKGKATCENLCFSGNSFSSAIGPVLNPYDKERSSGGSSSGCGVLVAVGEVDMAIGTDQGGSVRLPSSWCGIVGLKPTFGLVPYTGILSLALSIDHCGPMARTVHDCALLLEVLAGNDGLDPRQPSALPAIDYSQQLTGDVARLRVGLLKEGFEDCENDVADIVRTAAMSLTQLGVSVKEFSSDYHKLASAVGSPIISEGVLETYVNGGVNKTGFNDTETHDFLFSAARVRGDSVPNHMKTHLLLGGYLKEKYGSHFYSKATNLIRGLRADLDNLLKEFDAIVMPTINFKPSILLKKGATSVECSTAALENLSNTYPYNLTGNPALTINAGYSINEPRLPIGMMFVGRHFDELTILRLAHAFEGLRDSSSEYTDTCAQLKSSFNSA